MNLKNAIVCLLLLLGLEARAYRYFPRTGSRPNRFIRTDYNTCLQGIKDSTGTWVIQPMYEEINYIDEFNYVVGVGGKKGVIDSLGRIRIPIMYQVLGQLDYYESYECWKGYYYAMLDSKYGVIDSLNNTLLPFQYRCIYPHGDSTMLLGEGKKSWVVYYKSGKQYKLPWKSTSTPTTAMNHCYIMDKHRLFRTTKCGIIRDTGTIIQERKYDYITTHYGTQTYQLRNRRKCGYISSAGRLIWPVVFDDVNFYTYEYGTVKLGTYSIAPLSRHGKTGLVSIYGDTILDFVYDRIRPLSNLDHNTMWEVDSGNCSGLYDQVRGWIIKPDTLDFSPACTWYNETDSSSVCLIVTNQNGKWGAVLTTGQIVLPFVYEERLEISKSEYVFKHGDSLVQFEIPYPSTRSILLDRCKTQRKASKVYWQGERQSDNLSARLSEFHGDNGIISFYNSALAHEPIVVNDSVKISPSGLYYSTPLPDSVYLSTYIYIRPLLTCTSKTPDVKLYNVHELYQLDTVPGRTEIALTRHDSVMYMSGISNRYYNRNGPDFITTQIMDLLKEDGTMIMSGDSLGYISSFHRRSDGVFFFVSHNYTHQVVYDTAGRRVLTVPVGSLMEFSDRYYWTELRYDRYSIRDSKTGQAIPDEETTFDWFYPIWDSITLLKDTQYGMRLFDIANRKVLGPIGFNDIKPLSASGNCFLVRTCSGNFGIMDSHGRLIADTVYTSCNPVDYDTTLMQGGDYLETDYQVKFYRHWVISKGSTTLVVDVAHCKLLSPEEGLRTLTKLSLHALPLNEYDAALTDSFAQRNYEDYYGDVQVNCYLRFNDSIALNSWQLQCLMDSCYNSIRGSRTSHTFLPTNPCRYCKENGHDYMLSGSPHGFGHADYLVTFRSDSLITFSGFSQNSWFRKYNQSYDYFSNVMLFPDGPHQLLFDSLFNPATDWRNFVIDTILHYVNTHMNISGDCHNPAMIPVTLSDQFLITADGLLLYPEGFTESGHPLIITLSWNALDPYLSNRVKPKLPMSK